MTAERRRMSRTRILQGAAEILDSGVYGDLTVDALARALHMSKSTLYKYFASKEDVIVALVDEACATTEAELEDRRASSKGAREALAGLVEVYGAHADRVPRAVILQHRRLPAACQDRVEFTRVTVARSFREVIHRGTEAGEFGFSDPSLAATAFMAAARAATQAAARGEVTTGRGEAVRALVALFLPGLIGVGETTLEPV